MKPRHSFLLVLAVLIAAASAQDSKSAGILTAADLKGVVPSSFFYRGRSASTQLRNAGGIRAASGKYVLAGLVDTAGYASDVAQKYQGFFIAEVKVKIGGSELNPGEYGFGFVQDKFVLTDVGANEVLSVSVNNDANLKRPMPLKVGRTETLTASTRAENTSHWNWNKPRSHCGRIIFSRYSIGSGP